MAKHLGKELIFISQIQRDGSGTSPVDKEFIDLMQEDLFDIKGLSMSNGTYIATNFNAFVVKFKPEPKDDIWNEVQKVIMDTGISAGTKTAYLISKFKIERK